MKTAVLFGKPETGFEEIRARAAFSSSALPRSRLLARVDVNPPWPIRSESPVTRE